MIERTEAAYAMLLPHRTSDEIGEVSSEAIRHFRLQHFRLQNIGLTEHSSNAGVPNRGPSGPPGGHETLKGGHERF